MIVATVERKARQDELLVEKLEEMKRGKATLDKHEREKGALLGRVRRTLFETVAVDLTPAAQMH